MHNLMSLFANIRPNGGRKDTAGLSVEPCQLLNCDTE